MVADTLVHIGEENRTLDLMVKTERIGFHLHISAQTNRPVKLNDGGVDVDEQNTIYI